MQLVNLYTLSQGEIEGRTEGFLDVAFSEELPAGADAPDETQSLARRVLNGGYPELLGPGRTPRRSAWYTSYITTILQRDVRDIADIAGLSEMPRLLALLAARSTALFNRSDIARDLGWPRSTVDRYLSLLEMIFLFDLLPAWSGNLGKKLTRSPKVVFRDTGLASHLVGSDRNHPLPDHLFGRLLENFVVMELQRQVTWGEEDIQLFHFHTHGGSEIDILLEDRRGRVVAIEVKSTSSPTASMFRHMRRLEEDLGDRFHRGILLSRSENSLAFGPKLVTLPLDSLWTLGSQANG
jgi:predicted AAA+ superfamily ATPase